VAREAATGIRSVALATGIPVTFGLITALTEEQAWARAGGDVGNRGAEAAEAALEVRAERGDAAYWHVHDGLFANQKDLADDVLVRLATAEGARVDRVRRAIGGGEA